MATLGEALGQARQLFVGGQLAQAEALYRQLLAAAPQVAELWHDMGLLQMQAARPEAALEFLEKAVSLAPECAAYHSNLGAVYRKLRRTNDAVASFRRAVASSAPSPDLFNNLALALKDAGQTDAALELFDKALVLRPDYANGHFNRGNLLLDVGRLDEAIASYQKSLELNPADAGVYCKLGVAYYDQGHLDQAMASFERALEILPNYAEVRRNRGLVWLAQGQYSQGWSEFEWRLDCEGFAKREFAQPRWDGSPLAGRTLLAHAEQGLGDTLQFIRYVPLAEQSGGHIRVDVQPALVPLLTQSGFARWIVPPDAVGPFDVQCPLMSLPAHLPDRTGQPIWRGPYLAADPVLVKAWEGRLRDIAGFKVGIVWAGNPDHPHDRFRSVRLAEFGALAKVPGVRLIGLQKGAPRAQIADVGASFDVVDLGGELDETTAAFMDTAAVITHLDLVIAVDTSVAHLAGGLGANVWMPLQVSPDWRWLASGETTPWYPSMRLFRQRTFDVWPEVFAEMADQLRKIL